MGIYTEAVEDRYHAAGIRPDLGSFLWLSRRPEDATAEALDYIRIKSFVEGIISAHAVEAKCEIIWSSAVERMGNLGMADLENGLIYLAPGPYRNIRKVDDVFDVYAGIALHEVSHHINSKAPPTKEDFHNASMARVFYYNLFEDEYIEAAADLESPNFSWYLKRVKDVLLHPKRGKIFELLKNKKIPLDQVLMSYLMQWIRMPYVLTEKEKHWHPIKGCSLHEEMSELVNIEPMDPKYNAWDLSKKVLDYLRDLFKRMGRKCPEQYDGAGESSETEPEEPVGIGGTSASGSSESGSSASACTDSDSGETASGETDSGESAENSEKDKKSEKDEKSDSGKPELSEDVKGRRDSSPDNSSIGDDDYRDNVKTRKSIEADDRTVIENSGSDSKEIDNNSTLDKVRGFDKASPEARSMDVVVMTVTRSGSPDGSLERISDDVKKQIVVVTLTEMEEHESECIMGNHRKVVTRVPITDSLTKGQYRQDYKKVRGHIASLSRVFAVRQHHLDIRETERKRGRLNQRALGRAMVTDRLFERRSQQITTGLDLWMLVDESGSMYGKKIQTCRETAILLANALKTIPNVNLNIYGHTSADTYGGSGLDCSITKYVDEHHQDLTCLGAVDAHWNNIDGMAVKHVGEMALRDSRGQDVWLLVLSDGMPSAYKYHGDAADKHTKEQVKALEAKGLNVIGIAIENVRVDKIYTNFVKFTNNSTLAVDLKRLVSKIIRESTEMSMTL